MRNVYAYFKYIIFYIYPHIFLLLHIGFYWILMQTLYAFYIHVLHPLGGSHI